MADREQSSVSFLYEVSGRNRIGILILGVLEMLISIAGVCYALVLKEIVNSAVAGEHDRFIRGVAAFVGLIIFQLVMGALRRWLDERTRSALENRFKSGFLTRLLRGDFGLVSGIHSGELMNRLTSDTVVVANGMTGIIPGLIGMLVRLVGALVLIMILDPRFGVIIFPGAIILILFSYIFRRKLKEYHRTVQEKDGVLRMFLQDVLGSLLVVRAYAIEEDSIERARVYMSRHQRARMRRNYFSNFCNTGFGVVMNALYVIGAAFCGYGILTRTMSYGTFMAVLQLVGQIQAPFAGISGYLPQWYAMLASAERLLEAGQLAQPGCLPLAGEVPPGAGQFPEDARKPGDIVGEPSPERARTLSGEAGAAFIEPEWLLTMYVDSFEAIGLRGVSYSYWPPAKSLQRLREQNRVPVLKNFSLEIRKGEYVAFVGPSGCGKSTVMKLLLTLYRPDQGSRYIRFGGKERILDGRFQKLFAYVPQGNHLMSGTIRDIVTLSDRSRREDEAAIWTALRVACAEAFVRALKKGLDTELGERGLGLSEGQMQRLAIARAIFSGHPILLLDEATSALDEKTEKWLLNNLRTMTSMTVIIVTHRSAVLAICDRVIDFEKLTR